MSEEPIICCPAPETPPEVRSHRGPRALPPDLLRQAPLGPDGRPMARASAAQLREAMK
jgi:hypothetical protein